MTDSMKFEDLEKVYDLVAAAIDEAGPDSELFLCKLCLILAHHVDDVSVVERSIAAAREDLQT